MEEDRKEDGKGVVEKERSNDSDIDENGMVGDKRRKE